MVDEVKNFDMKVYLAFQNMVFSKEFEAFLNNFGIRE
jgi:hypothetical protein